MHTTKRLNPAERTTLALLASPARWRLWPILTVIRDTAGGRRELGIVLDTRSLGFLGMSATVFKVNVFDVIGGTANYETAPKEVYDSAEEIVAAGWRAD